MAKSNCITKYAKAPLSLSLFEIHQRVPGLKAVILVPPSPVYESTPLILCRPQVQPTPTAKRRTNSVGDEKPGEGILLGGNAPGRHVSFRVPVENDRNAQIRYAV